MAKNKESGRDAFFLAIFLLSIKERQPNIYNIYNINKYNGKENN